MRTRVAMALVLLISLGARAEAKRPRHRSHASSSFVAFHTARVKHDLMMFHPDYPGLAMAVRHDVRDGDSAGAQFSFVTPSRAAEPFDVVRARDRLRLFRPANPPSANTALGVAIFSTVTMMSAHLPDPLRVVFDGPIHLGPAVFDDGGMGAGVAAVGL